MAGTPYQSIYSGSQIDSAIGKVYENNFGVSYAVTQQSWTTGSSGTAYQITLVPSNFGSGVVFSSTGMDLAFYDTSGNRYYFWYTVNASTSITVNSNTNIAGTFYLYYGAQQQTSQS